MAIIALVLVLSYLLGSISGSLLLGRFVGVVIRAHGSGNAGGTNAFRTRGWKFALAVVASDVAKGALAGALGAHFAPSAVAPLALGLACVLAAMVGHTWPVFYGFRGGKGAGTLIGGLLWLWPASVAPLIAFWALVLSLTGYVGLATVCAGFGLIALAWRSGAHGFAHPYLGFACAAAVFLLFTHRANLSRLRAGTEHRFERARVWRRLFGRGSRA
jgi:glycerol-3-phosphate acyltransferase PlsY